MKLQAPLNSAFLPAAFAAASISLALLLLPAGAAPRPTSGVAPALKLVAGDVVAAVETPVRAVTGAHHPKPVAVFHPKQTAVAPATTRSHSAPVRKSNVPAHHRRTAHRRVPRLRAVARTPVVIHATPHAPISPVVEHGHGKANAWGHAKKLTPKAPPAVIGAAPDARADHGHGHAYGRPADVPHGPPAVPPGLAKGEPGTNKPAAPPGRGGGK